MEVQDYILADDADYDQFSGSLVGISVITAKLKQLFKFKHIPLVLNDNWQGALVKAYGIAHNVEKTLPDPYCYLKISSLGVKEDAHNLNQSMRNGTGFGARGASTGDLSNALLDMQYFAWAKVNIELCVGFRNPLAFFVFCERLSIAIKARNLAATANYENNSIGVYADPQQSEISPVMMSTDDATTAGWLTLNHALTIHTQFGTSVGVAKLNNEGNITNNIEVYRE